MRKLFILIGLLLTLSLSGQLLPGVVASQAVVSGGYCAEYQAVYDAYVTKPDNTVAQNQNTFVKTLIDGDVFERGSVIYLFANDNATDALINFANPGTYDAVNTTGVNFTSLEGFTGASATTEYMVTGFNATNDSSKYKKNDCSIAIYTRGDINGNEIAISATDGTNAAILYPRYLNDIYARINGNSNGNKAVDNSLGLTVITRSDWTTMSFFRGASDLGDATKQSTGIPNDDFELFHLSGGTAWSNNQISFVFIGSNLTNDQISTMNTAIETYMDSNGKGVQ